VPGAKRLAMTKGPSLDELWNSVPSGEGVAVSPMWTGACDIKARIGSCAEENNSAQQRAMSQRQNQIATDPQNMPHQRMVNQLPHRRHGRML